MFAIEIIWDKLSAKYNIMNARFQSNRDKEPENALYVCQNQVKVLQLWYIWAKK